MNISSQRIRIGIVGLGTMGGSYAKSILQGSLPDAYLTAVCDLAPNLKDRFPEQRLFSDPEEMFRSGEVDAVIIATPHYSHTPLGIAALEAGLHVLVEKPISVHKADCERLLAAHKDPSLVFAVMFNMRTRPVFRTLKRLIDRNELGAIRRIQWTITDWFRTQAYYDSGTWRGTWKGEGGGVLINQCPHQLDLWQWLFGMPSRVYARCQFGRYHDIEVEDDVNAVLEYANGCIGNFITSTGEAPGVNRLEIAGDAGLLTLERGVIRFQRNEVPMDEFLRTSPERMGAKPPVWDIEIPPGNARPLPDRVQILQNFLEAIQGKETLIAPAAEGIHSVELGNAMLLSSLQGRTIDLPMDGQAFERELHRLISESQK